MPESPDRNSVGTQESTYFIYKEKPEGDPTKTEMLPYVAPEGPNGLIAQLFKSELGEAAEKSGDLGISSVSPSTSFNVGVRLRVAKDIEMLLNDLGISFEVRGPQLVDKEV